MPYIGKVTEFSEGKESVNEIKNEKKVAVFLSVVGATAYGVVRNLVQPDLPKGKSYQELI
ncbi:hypothetical protein DPMN_121572 [Dreissena polymorpha]|uniref:Uncharacterized protein n=1 Tax=Dreissena polymorpha TaxID=45954 RepID=A0A9D4JR67_DREPO|nr:hypothetical protein DPMN_121572 [Dreissena polymorpha]